MRLLLSTAAPVHAIHHTPTDNTTCSNLRLVLLAGEAHLSAHYCTAIVSGPLSCCQYHCTHDQRIMVHCWGRNSVSTGCFGTDGGTEAARGSLKIESEHERST